MKITVMGLGYIGLPTAITLAEAGFEVCGFDVNKKTIETLQGGHIHIVEPGLQEAFEKAVAHGHLHFSDTLGKSDVFYISVPTPFYKDETGSHSNCIPNGKYFVLAVCRLKTLLQYIITFLRREFSLR